MRVYWYWPFVRDEELALGAALAARGHEVALHTIGDRLAEAPPPGMRMLPSLPGVPERRERSPAWLASRALVYPRRALRRARAVAAEQPDVAHVVYLNYFTDGLTLGRLARRAPLVSTVHDVVPHQARVPARVERALLARQYASAGTIVVHHPSVGELLCTEFGVDPARVHHLPWAVPEIAATARPGEPDPFVVLLFGTLRRNKGAEVLLDAFARLPGDGLRLVVAGRGFADVEAAVGAAAARDRRITVEIARATEARKRELYAGADLVVLPYTSFASQSAVLHDAYAHHRAVVVSDVGALGEAVRADGTGWVVPPGDADALAGAIDDARRDRARRETASGNAATAAAARRPAAVAAALEAVYRTARRGRGDA